MYSESKYPHNNFLGRTDNVNFYDSRFRSVLEDHLTYIRTTGNVKKINVSPGEAFRFENNFYRLLENHGIPQYLWWISMRVTGMTEPHQMTRQLSYYLLPDETILNQIAGFHASLKTT